MMMRSSSPLAVLLTMLLLTAVALVGCRGSGERIPAAFRPLDVGAPVPLYTARTLTGDTVRIGAGEPVTLINVWATWCTSCREEMTDLTALQHEYGPKGLRVVGVSVDQGSDERVERFASAQHLTFAITRDPAGDIQQRYEVVGVPTSYLIGHDGRLLWRHTGNLHDVLPEVRQVVDRAIAPTGGGAP